MQPTTLLVVALRDAWTAEVDRWLAELVEVAVEGTDPRCALVAVGGYGRAELSLQSDIDVVLLHRGRDDIGQLADRLWYLIWDARMKLGHAVRTSRRPWRSLPTTSTPPPACCRCATWPATGRSPTSWRTRPTCSGASGRPAGCAGGPGATLPGGRGGLPAQPDLKEGRGGLRDVHAGWAQAARSIRGTPTRPASAPPTSQGRPGRPAPAHRPARRPPAAAGAGRDRRRHWATPTPTCSCAAWPRPPAPLPGPATTPGPASTARSPVRSAGPPAPATWAVVCGCAMARWPSATTSTWPAIPRWRCGRRRWPQRTAPSSTGRRWPGWPPKPPCRPRRGATPPAALVDLLAAGLPAIVLLEALDQQGVWERYVPEWGRAQQAPAQRLPPLHRRPSPVGGGARAPWWPGHPPRPAGAGGPVPRHRQGRARRPHAERRAPAGRHRAPCGPRRARHRGAGRPAPPPPAAGRRGHPARHRRPGHHRGRRARARQPRGAGPAGRPHRGRLAGDRPAAWSDWKAGLVRALGDPGRPRAGQARRTRSPTSSPTPTSGLCWPPGRRPSARQAIASRSSRRIGTACSARRGCCR